HPWFLLEHRYGTIRSQVRLVREEKPDLVPDFILEPVSQTDFWKIVELKLPSARMVRRFSANRVTLSAAITEALAQLREYRDYFDDPTSRRQLRELGIHAFKPEICVIIGRDYGNLNVEETLSAKRDFGELEVVTYNELVERAKRMTWL